MMKNLHITVVDKIATYIQRDGTIVCGNSDYQIVFTFDNEWNKYTTKTARFRWGGENHDVTFNGTICPVPVISDATAVIVGVFVDELSSTPVIIPCKRSILCSEV